MHGISVQDERKNMQKAPSSHQQGNQEGLHRLITHIHRNLSRPTIDLSCRRFAPGRTQLPGTKSPAWVPPGLIVAVRPGSPLLCGLVSTRLWQLLQPGSGQSHLPRPRTRVIAVASVKRARCNAPIVSCFTWFRGGSGRGHDSCDPHQRLSQWETVADAAPTRQSRLPCSWRRRCDRSCMYFREHTTPASSLLAAK